MADAKHVDTGAGWVAVPDPLVIPDPDVAPTGQGGEPLDAGDDDIEGGPA
jgi:hypothetical protein